MIAVAGGKGGVGKSTTAIGLAASFARRRRRPLVVDADTDMPDLAAMTGLEPEPGVAEVVQGADPELAARPAPHHRGVAVLPTTPGTEVKPALRHLPRDRPVILDCPAGASDTAVTPVASADETVLVTTPDRAAIEDTLKTAALARTVDTAVTAVVVTRTTNAPEGIAPAFGTDLVLTTPAVAGDPLRASAVRVTYDRLAAHVWGKG